MDKRGLFFPLRDENDSVGSEIVNWSLIIINIVVFFFSLTAFEATIRAYGFTPAEFSLLTLFTSMFLHGGFGHLFGNMWFLYIFGDNVEHEFGHFLYLLFYVLAGVAASLTHYFVEMGSVIPAVGASGAISGVLGAYLVLYPRAGVYVSGGLGHVGKVSALFMLLLWFGFQFISGVVGLFGAQQGIAFWAHIGGFVFGVVFALIYRSFRRPSVSRARAR